MSRGNKRRKRQKARKMKRETPKSTLLPKMPVNWGKMEALRNPMRAGGQAA